MGFLTKHRIQSGAFKASLANNANIPIFFQHNWSWSEQPPIGTGLATVVASPKPGLKVAADFFLDTDSGRSTFRAIKAGALREWSIGYRISKFEVEEDDDGFDIVIVKEADLMEASSVLRGANPDTETLKVSRQLPPEVDEVMKTIAGFMQSSTQMFDLVAKRMDAIEAAHDLLIGTLEDGGYVRTGDGPDGPEVEAKPSSGESVEPAAGTSGTEPEAETTATQPPQEAPDSPEVDADLEALAEEMGPDRLDRAMERAQARISSKWEAFVEQAGPGLDNPDANPSSRQDIASMERVLRCLNLTKHTYDAVEQQVTARVLAESASNT
jgi:HK97 family phage prohead protease